MLAITDIRGLRWAIVVALVAALLLTLPTTVEAKSKRQRCLDAAAKVVGHKIKNPARYNIMLGTAQNDTFRATRKRDLICGFYRFDQVNWALRKGDIFIGGRNADRVMQLRGGRFVGGSGHDSVKELGGGTFIAGHGGGSVYTRQTGGRFVGGGDRDWVETLRGGVFRGDGGDDRVGKLQGGRFLGEGGSDRVGSVMGGVYRGGPGDDEALYVVGGLFEGGPGDDEVGMDAGCGPRGCWRKTGLEGDGTFLAGTGDDIVKLQSGGTYDGGAGIDEVRDYSGGTLISVEICTPAAGFSCP